MLIHFVCSGNTNRSRMAEAYFNSKKISGMTATSSGTHASHNFNGPITFFAKNILQKKGILEYTAKTWQETNKELLKKADVVVFIKKKYFDFVNNELGYVPSRYYIWNIKDVESVEESESVKKINENKIRQDETVFNNIKKAVDRLVVDLQKTV